MTSAKLSTTRWKRDRTKRYGGKARRGQWVISLMATPSSTAMAAHMLIHADLPPGKYRHRLGRHGQGPISCRPDIQELEEPGKGKLDAYLKPFIRKGSEIQNIARCDQGRAGAGRRQRGHGRRRDEQSKRSRRNTTRKKSSARTGKTLLSTNNDTEQIVGIPPLARCSWSHMTILVTGSAGHLGEAILRTLRRRGSPARGIDLKASPFTDAVGSIVDPGFVRAQMDGVTAVIHTATLHKPHVATHSKQAFVDTNVTGTLNLLEAAVAAGVKSSFSPAPPAHSARSSGRRRARPRCGSPRSCRRCPRTFTARPS